MYTSSRLDEPFIKPTHISLETDSTRGRIHYESTIPDLPPGEIRKR